MIETKVIKRKFVCLFPPPPQKNKTKYLKKWQEKVRNFSKYFFPFWGGQNKNFQALDKNSQHLKKVQSLERNDQALSS